MDCKKICSLAFDFEKGILEKKASELIKNHLKTCKECKKYFTECKKLIESYPCFERDFKFPENLDIKIKKSLENLEKSSVL